MKRMSRVLGVGLLMSLFLAGSQGTAFAASAREINRDAAAALKTLYAKDPTARALGKQAQAILVFPKIWKAGLVIGGQSGNGALLEGSKVIGHYNTTAASYGFQAGVQSFGYALFFMNKSALQYLDKSDGWEVGTGPSLVVVDEGFAKSFTSTTLTQDVYAITFDQKGLMGGIGIQGSKITRIHPGK